MKALLPFSLKRGDVIGVVSPAGVANKAALRRGIKTLVSLGFRVKLGAHVLARDSFYAGNHRWRKADLNGMIRDPAVKAILCARGGYGSVYLLEDLDYKTLRRQAKIIMGASDVTVLLNTIHARTGLITFHGPMVATNFSKGEAGVDLDSFRNALMGGGEGGQTRSWSLPLRREEVIRPGRDSGRLVGGCLSLLISSLGTPYEFNSADSILFIEDVNEPPYRLDRMLKQLGDAGKFRQVHGVVLGDMLNCVDEKHPRWKAQNVLESYFRNFKGPVIRGLHSGHTRNPFVTLPIGVRVTLDTRADPRLIVEEATTR
ncbi:MAG: LD-carboxypeptidase [Acidobacteriia bacterium]|nr:LD-carboxypeptidase [Terriglobia bacterium]